MTALTGAAFYMFYTRASIRTTKFLVRLNAWLHIFALISWSYNDIDRAWMARACLVRALTSVMVFDELDENLFSLLPFAALAGVKFGWTSTVCFLSFRLVLFLVLPLQVLGVREWIYRNDFVARTNSMTLLVSLVPLFAVLFAFGANHFYNYQEGSGMRFSTTAASGIQVIICTICAGYAKQIDKRIMPSVVFHPNEIDPPITAVFVLSASVLATVSLPTSVVLLLSGAYLPVKPKTRAVCTHVLALALALLVLKSPVAVIMITTVRVFYSLARIKVSEIQIGNSLLGFLTIALSTSSKVHIAVSFLCLLALCMNLIAARSRENTARLIKREMESQAFLSHGA
jgi:hypothetical protein